MSLVKKMLNYSFWLLIGNSIGRLSMFLTNIIAARFLSQELFGQFMMIRSTISMIEGIISGSLGSPIIKRVAETSHQNKESLKVVISTLFVVNISIALLFSTLLYLTTPSIINTFFISEKNLINGLYIGIAILIATTLATLIQNILIGLEQYKKLAFSGIVSSLLSFPLIVILIYSFELYGAIVGVALYFTIDFIVKYIQFKKVYSYKIFLFKNLDVKNESKNILKFSIPLFLSVIINGIAFWYARVLTINDTHGFESIAIFDAAFQWMTVIMIITGATTSATLPMLSKSLSKKVNDSKNVFKINLIVNLSISIIMASIFIIFSKNIMAIYGENYVVGKTDLIILSITSIFFTLAVIYNRLMVASNKSWIIFFATSVGVLVLYITYYLKIFEESQNLSLSILSYYFTISMIYLVFNTIIKKEKYE